jgi:hypothetical protein
VPNPLTRAARRGSLTPPEQPTEGLPKILETFGQFSGSVGRPATAPLDHALASAATRKVFRGPRSGERSYNGLIMSRMSGVRVFPKHNPDEITEKGLQHE